MVAKLISLCYERFELINSGERHIEPVAYDFGNLTNAKESKKYLLSIADKVSSGVTVPEQMVYKVTDIADVPFTTDAPEGVHADLHGLIAPRSLRAKFALFLSDDTRGNNSKGLRGSWSSEAKIPATAKHIKQLLSSFYAVSQSVNHAIKKCSEVDTDVIPAHVWQDIKRLTEEFSVDSIRSFALSRSEVVPGFILFTLSNHINTMLKPMLRRLIGDLEAIKSFPSAYSELVEQCRFNSQLVASGGKSKLNVELEFLGDDEALIPDENRVRDRRFICPATMTSATLGYAKKVYFSTYSVSQINKVFGPKARRVEDILKKAGTPISMLNGEGSPCAFHLWRSVETVGQTIKDLAHFAPEVSVYRSEFAFYSQLTTSKKNHNQKFFMFKRSDKEVAGLTHLFADIDVGDSVLSEKNISKEHREKAVKVITHMLYAWFDSNNFPRPSVAPVFTGGGIHVRWAFDESVETNRFIEHNGGTKLACEMWREAEKKLCLMLRRFGADIKATDMSRVLRPVNTINHKYGHECDYIHLKDEPVRYYGFESLCKAIIDAEGESVFNGNLARVCYVLRKEANLSLAKEERVKKNLAKAYQEPVKQAANKSSKKSKRRKKNSREVPSVIMARSRDDLCNMTEEDYKSLAVRHLEYTSSREVRQRRKAMAKVRIKKSDKTDYKTRCEDIAKAAKHAAKENGGVLPTGRRNAFFFHYFISAVNARRDMSKYIQNEKIGPRLLVLDSLAETGQVLEKAGLSREWIDAHGASYMGYDESGAMGESAGGSAAQNTLDQARSYWETGTIRNSRNQARVALRKYKGEDEVKAKIEEHGITEEVLDAGGSYPMLGYTVSTEEIMADLALTDAESFESGCVGLYSDVIRKKIRDEYRQFTTKTGKMKKGLRIVSIEQGILDNIRGKTPATRALLGGISQSISETCSVSRSTVTRVTRKLRLVVAKEGERKALSTVPAKYLDKAKGHWLALIRVIIDLLNLEGKGKARFSGIYTKALLTKSIGVSAFADIVEASISWLGRLDPTGKPPKSIEDIIEYAH